MDFKNRLLFGLAETQLSKNKKFKNCHKGESCYIFGNGVSLKSMNFKKFDDKISMGCNSLFLHTDFHQLNCLYYQMPATFFYKYRKFYGKLQRNYLADLYQEKMRKYPEVNYFTSLSNFPVMRGRNIHYVHHFGKKEWNVNDCEMDGAFSFMMGATYAMLGAAIYMGFAKAILVGCDYTFSPTLGLHFFEKGRGSIGGESPEAYRVLLNELQKQMEIETIVPAGMKSDVLNFIEYEKLTNTPEHYLENTKIVDRKDLQLLSKLGFYEVL